ncbi:MAG: peptidoglycan-binding protein [Desertimonas sp.]
MDGTWTRLTRGRSAPIVTAGALVGAVALVAAVGAQAGGNEASSTARRGQENPTSTVLSAPSTTTTTLPPTTTTSPKSTLTQTLYEGSYGDEVRRLQERLAELGFQPGPIDGNFGSLTEQAVWAYETLVQGKNFWEVDGDVTPEMWLDLQDPLPIDARRPNAGRHTEIYLPQQALVVYDGADPLFIAHISSGDIGAEGAEGRDLNQGAEWCEEVTIDVGESGNENGTEPLKKGVCGNAWTPGGVYTVHRRVEGVRESRLGGMLNPVYFNNGIAVHGAYQVPDYPASHGCIRIANLISADYFALMGIGDGVYVWDGENEPEYYGNQSGWWDWADPNYTTTTSATTTTAAPPTTRPATTVATTSPPQTTRAPQTTAAPVTTPAPTTTVAAVPSG